MYFSFKVWNVFLLVGGRREHSKPRFGALRTSRTKRSDACRKSVDFAETARNVLIQIRRGIAKFGRNLSGLARSDRFYP